MTSAFRNLFDSVIAALGGGFDKPTASPAPQPAQQSSSQSVPDKAIVMCRVCKVMPAKPVYNNEYCDADCVRREMDEELADRMDAWHDQFQERFGDD